MTTATAAYDVDEHLREQMGMQHAQDVHHGGVGEVVAGTARGGQRERGDRDDGDTHVGDARRWRYRTRSTFAASPVPAFTSPAIPEADSTR